MNYLLTDSLLKFGLLHVRCPPHRAVSEIGDQRDPYPAGFFSMRHVCPHAATGSEAT